MGTPVPEQAVLHVARTLEAAGVCYAFMGGLALNAWAIPRTTFDIDCVVAVDDAAFPSFLQTLAVDDVEVDEAFLRGFRDTLSGMEKVNASLSIGGAWFRLDIFRAGTPFLESVMQRRVATPVGELESVYVVSAADLLLFKLIAGRRKDWVDIDNLVAVQGVPERDYLQHWAGRLGVEERLRKVLGTGI